MAFSLAMLIALILDAAIGWPGPVYRRIGHPVTWLGRVITGLESRLNRPGIVGGRVLAGAFLVLIAVALAAGAALALVSLLPDGAIGAALTGVLAWPLVAANALHAHVRDVADPLARSALDDARQAVAKIVGRDPAQLDDVGVARAAIESLAENTSDGVVAPLFWGCLLGLPGIAAYKAINTLDSMIGHFTPRYQDFGKAAARLDDLANLIPARLTGLLFATVSRRPRAAIQSMRRDAARHRSPNAGWPEAAMAGALAVRLSGPRIYAGTLAQEPFVNAACPDPEARDLRAGLALFYRSMILVAAVLALLALL